MPGAGSSLPTVRSDQSRREMDVGSDMAYLSSADRLSSEGGIGHKRNPGSTPVVDLSNYALSQLRAGDLALYRGSGDGIVPILLVTAENTSLDCLKRLDHEYAVRAELDPDWSAKPEALLHYNGRLALVLKDPGGEPLDRLLGKSLELSVFLRLAIQLAKAIGGFHKRGLIHKDIKPTNILVDIRSGGAWLTGFGLVSRMPREHRAPEPPDIIVGSLPYMAPEQTGRMNRSIDSRSDLYSFGVVLYQIATGSLPFSASDPMEWVHCHVARKPVPPSEQSHRIPASVSAIVMKLLAKTPEERYQTAAGVEHDLRRCLTKLEAGGDSETFLIGEHDHPDRLMIPEKLYGRAREVDALLTSFNEVLATGTPALTLVTGYSGMGKSSIVNELHKLLVPARALFASGKFEQFKTDVPYATFAHAFRILIRQLLGKSEDELSKWREALSEALHPDGSLIQDLVPELTIILGDQPPVIDLPPKDAQRRFQRVVRRFISVFAQPEHPLVLFLDDLQWLDAATIDLVGDLITAGDVHNLLLVGAYRSNEMAALHPLSRKLDTLQQCGARVRTITLPPLALDDVQQLLADTLNTAFDHVLPLASLVQKRTGGNPFFAIQFLNSLADEGLLAFDHDATRWSWNQERTLAKGSTDNVVDLIERKLARLPEDTQQTLRQLACLGNTAEAAMLHIACESSPETVDADLWEAMRQGLILRTEHAYKFAHDRIQEAAYSTIPESQRADAHLRIGRLLAAHASPKNREGAIFDIVNQLNRAAAQITSRDERAQLAELNLTAGKRAKASAAYVSALKYFSAGAVLISQDARIEQRDLAFSLELHRAECEFLTGDFAAAEVSLTRLWSAVANPVDRAAVACLRCDLYTTLNQSDHAVEVCLTYLRYLGIEWSPHPTDGEVRREYDQTWALLGDRKIEQLIDLPLMTNPEARATLNVLSHAMSPALFIDINLATLLLWRMVNISLVHGNTDASCYAYVHAGATAGPKFGNYMAGFQFGRLAYDLVERHDLKKYRARTYLAYGVCVESWTKHWRLAREPIRNALDIAYTAGDLTYVGYSWQNLIGNLLAVGDPLADVQHEAERALEFVQKARFGMVIDTIMAQRALIRTLRGLTDTFGSFNDSEFDEHKFELHLSSDARLAFAACWYWTRKLQARFLAGDYAAAIDASQNAQRLIGISPSFIETAEAHFYGALSHAAECDSADPAQYQDHFEALTAHYKQLEEWAENGGENFENRVLLVGAEIARIEGRELDAERLYEFAIKSARANGFVHNEGLAQELAAQFYMARGFEVFSNAYLQNARSCYLRWGADGKVRQLDQMHPHLILQPAQAGPGSTIGTAIEQLDLKAVVKVSQAISGEIEFESLIKIFMKTALEEAGARRGLLILPFREGMRIEAEATTTKDVINVHRPRMPVNPSKLPKSVFHYVQRTSGSVLLNDASQEEPFLQDEYIRRNKSRSILCLPLIKQTQFVGALYLENDLATHVFTPGRFAMLRLLASQAATSLENARLYSDLRDAEAFLAQAQSLSQTGSFGWSSAKAEIVCSDETHRIFEFDRSAPVSLESIFQRVHPDDAHRARAAFGRAPRTGEGFDLEFRLLLPDASIRHVHVVAHGVPIDTGGVRLIGAVMDVTSFREAQERLGKAQAELTEAGRLTRMGELASLIVHEVTQPLSAIVTNADSCLLWLAREMPNLDRARKAAERIVRDGHRAGEIVRSIRNQTQKSASDMAQLSLNHLIGDTLELMQSDLLRHDVTLETQFAHDPGLIKGDSTELQQVIVNLVTNAIEAISMRAHSAKLLRVSTEFNEAGDVMTSVEDSGPGIDPKILDRIFDPRFSTKPRGMGLGLSICRSIVERHGGQLWASQSPSGGSIFRFIIPGSTVATTVEANVSTEL